MKKGWDHPISLMINQWWLYIRYSIAKRNLCNPFNPDLHCAIFFPSFLFENKLNTTERGTAEVRIERVTEITVMDETATTNFVVFFNSPRYLGWCGGQRPPTKILTKLSGFAKMSFLKNPDYSKKMLTKMLQAKSWQNKKF